MNSYPSELLNHHFACMLVAGLVSNSGNASSSSTTASTTSPAVSTVPLPNNNNSPSSSPSISKPDLPSFSPHQQPSHIDPQSSKPTDVFPLFCKELVDIFNSRGRSTVWDPARARAAVFHSVLVDHNVRLPPHKTKVTPRSVLPPPTNRPPTTSPQLTTKPLNDVTDAAAVAALAALPPRSPLSPLHPGSPLFPDGLIAPIWARKHRELVPCVFIAFHCLSTRSNDSQIIENTEALRKKDQELIKAIADRKKTLTERGIKMTAVLLTSRDMLEDPQLEARLSYIRRTSGLDSRASLFVLTPVSRQELGEFVTSLQAALYDVALDYYREHARRVKRKRARYPPPASTFQPILSAVSSLGKQVEQAPLSREGWIVRAEYKLGTFAELQGDIDEALLRYRETYDILSGPCLGSTMMLPPRTKRWAEAKVLADTLNIKIAKFYLYKDDGAAAIKQLQRHLHRFTELSTGWGIGSMTFEYWSWLYKQYRMFADLMDHATRVTPSSPLPPFKLPIHDPPLPSRLLHPNSLSLLDGIGSSLNMLTPNQNAIDSTAAPALLIQGPGAFYYLAALCTMERRDRFRKVAATQDLSTESLVKNPTLAHEAKVDYTTQITEQLTRAYECFKKSKMQRLSLSVAAKIAVTYYEGEQYEMALRFLERIIRTYGRDSCDLIRAGLLEIAADCAQRIQDVENTVKMLLELLSLRLALPKQMRQKAGAALTRVLQENSLTEAETEAATIQVETTATDGIVLIDMVFFESSVQVGSLATFQVRLTAPQGGNGLESIHFDSLAMHIHGLDTPVTIQHQTTNEMARSEVVNLGLVKKNDVEQKQHFADLTWAENTCKAFQGSVAAESVGVMAINKVVLRKDGRVPLELVFNMSSSSLFTSSFKLVPSSSIPGLIRDSRWLVQTHPKLRWISMPQRECCDAVVVRPRTYQVVVTADYKGSTAYLDERYPVTLTIKNEDQEPLECTIDAALQPLFENDKLFYEKEAPDPTNQYRNVACGRLDADETRTVHLYLQGCGKAGTRTIDAVVRCCPVTAETNQNDDTEAVESGTTAAVAVAVATAATTSFTAMSFSNSMASLQDETGSGSGTSDRPVTISIPVGECFDAKFQVKWQETGEASRPVRGLLDLSVDGEHDDMEEGDEEDDDGILDFDMERLPAKEIVSKANRQRHKAVCTVLSHLEVVGQEAVVVAAIRFGSDDADDPKTVVRLQNENEEDHDDQHAELLGLWEPRDRFSLVYRVLLLLPRSASIPRCYIDIDWYRPSAASSNHPPTTTTTTTTRLFLPPLVLPPSSSQPPLGLADVSAVTTTLPSSSLLPAPAAASITSSTSPSVTVVACFPSTSHLDNRIDVTLVLTNLHPTTSTSLTIVTESSDNFAFAGSRKLSIPYLLALERRSIHLLRLVPLRIGLLDIPTITVWNGQDRVEVYRKHGLAVQIL